MGSSKVYTPSREVERVLDALREEFLTYTGRSTKIGEALSKFKGQCMVNGLEIDYHLQDNETHIKLEIILR